jgi:O-antigen/teichoic acid export membrane protein
LIGFVLLGSRDVLVTGAQALGRPLLGSGVYWLGAVMTALLLLLLMPHFGIVGAAIATTCSAAIQLAVTVFGLRRSSEFRVRSLFRVDFSAARVILADLFRSMRPIAR